MFAATAVQDLQDLPVTDRVAYPVGNLVAHLVSR